MRQKLGHYRWWIVGLLFFATTINYIDRQVIALLKGTLTTELAWSPDHAEEYYSWIAATFQALYAMGYLFGGRLMDVIGLRRGYTLSVTLWSLAAAAGGMVNSVFGFCFVRGALGLAEGGNFPAAVKAVTEWFPKKERALATGIFNAGSNFGPVLTPPLVAWLTLNYGWRSAFYVTGSFGALFVVAWLLMYKRPEEHPRVSPEELAHIQSDPPDPAGRVSWGALLKVKGAWAFIVGTAFGSPIWWFWLFWAPDFFDKRFGLDLKNVGLPLIAIYLLADVGSVGAGWLSSFFIRHGWDPVRARKAVMLGCALCVVPVTMAATVPAAWGAVGLIGLAAAAHQGWSCNLYTLVSDTLPRHSVSSVVGMGGLAGSAMGMFFSLYVGKVLQETHSYSTIMFLAPVAYLAALAIIHLLLPARREAGAP